MPAKQNDPPHPRPETVDDALGRYWVDRSVPGSHVPDYAGFMEWFLERGEAAKKTPALPIHAKTSDQMVTLTLELLRAGEAAGIEISSDGAVPNTERFGKLKSGKSSLKALNKAKLLFSFFKQLPPRTLEMYAILHKAGDLSPAVGTHSSQLEHRAAFFRAVAAGDQHLAFKMIGRLREEEHDVGELAFLEATASFHANRFDEAIQHAREVPKDAIDWPRAHMLVLESYALQGDARSAAAEMGAYPDFTFPAYFIPYICQIVVEQSLMPEDTLKSTETLLHDTGARTDEIGAFVMWNRHSCQLAVRLVEQLSELALVDLARNDGFDELERSPLRIRQLVCALSIDVHLSSKLQDASEHKASMEIVKRLLNHGAAEPEDYLRALLTQWKIDDHQTFLDNVMANLNVLTTYATTEAQQLLLWAYQEAQISNRQQDVERIRRKLSETPAMATKLQEAEEATVLEERERHLSPMGKLALRSAIADLRQAEAESQLWRDAGMLSLGFFRILELEFNYRLAIPALREFDFDAFEMDLETIRASKQSATTKKAIEFWDRILGQLRRAKQSEKGLELGALEFLLRKVATVGGIDSALKARIHLALLARLSPTGVDVLSSGQLANLVAEPQRERFRNPPAHTRYVSLATAIECKEYVYKALDLLIASTTPAANNTAMH